MKCLRGLFALVLVCALCGIARADDFKLGVQDAPTTDIEYTGSPLTVGFSSCHNGVATDGCVTIANDTGATLTSLVIDILADSVTRNDGGGGCASETAGITCNYSLIDNGTEYQFLFTGLDIPSDSTWCTSDTFTIEEQGIDPSRFPDATVRSVTPEPASLLLLATGFFLIAGFVYRRRMGAPTLGS
jgi:PEP-CTERM motif